MKKIVLIISSIIVVVLGVVIFLIINNSNKAKFSDDEAKFVIVSAAIVEGIVEDEKDFKQEHFNEIKEVNIGYIGKCETIIDIAKCENLENLTIGSKRGYTQYYQGDMEESVSSLSSLEVEKFQEELSIILQKCSKLKLLKIVNENNSCELTNLEFFKGIDNLEGVKIEQINDVDYSPLYELTNLISLRIKNCNLENVKGIDNLSKLCRLSLDYTNISVADDIVKIESLQELSIIGTPLAENKEELDRIYERFPNIELITQ